MTITADHTRGPSTRTIAVTAATAGLALVLSVVLPLTLRSTARVIEQSAPVAAAGAVAPASYAPALLRQAHGG